MNVTRLINLLKLHEGFRSRPYRDTEGLWTVGYGTLLADGLDETEARYLLGNRPLTESQAAWLLKHRALPAIAVAQNLAPNWDRLGEVRQIVLADMAYNLGERRLARFQRMLAALALDDFDKAADEMVDSRWYTQVGTRAERLVAAMRTGLLSEDTA